MFFSKITQAVTEQMDTLGHSTNIYYHTKLHEYAKKLAEKLPDKLEVCYLRKHIILI